MTEVIKVIVKPKSSKSEIAFSEEKGCYVAYVKAPPEKGKANAELVKLIRSKLKKRAVIIKGKASKEKLVEIE